MSDRNKTVTIKIYDDRHRSNWASISFSRAVKFWAESTATDSNVYKAIAAYYSLFHFGSFFLLMCTVEGNRSPQARIERTIDSRSDPRRSIQHPYMETFLTELVSLGMPEQFLSAFRKSREMREFVNYGPDLLRERSGLRVDNRKFTVDDLSDQLARHEQLVKEALAWFTKWHSEPDLVASCIDRVSPYFAPHEDNDGLPFYRDWSDTGVCATAEKLIRELHEIAHQIAFPDSHKK